MIREANKFDIEAVIGMLKNYREMAPIDILKLANDEQYIQQMISEIISGIGFILLAERDGEIAGMLIAASVPNIWNPQTKQCSEVAYWVEEKYRGTTLGYRLLAAYIEKCEEWKKKGKIHFYTVTKMKNSPDLKYEKLGFDKLEETYFR